MSRLCLCLTAPTADGAVEQYRRYRDSADMAELRVDLMDPSERRKAVGLPALLGIPMILTIRLPEDGGRWGLGGETAAQREDLFIELLRAGGWRWIDLEHDRPLGRVVRAAEKAGCRVIRSVHDFEGSLIEKPVSGLAEMLRGMAADGAAAKMALSCRGSRHLLKLARLGLAAGDMEDKVILGMGEYGSPSRILAGRLGSAWTYASSVGGSDDPPAAAPGQYDPQTLQELYRYSSIDDATPLYAVIGNPIAHSRSPEIHNRWLRAHGLPGTYLPIRCDDAAAALETCDIWGISGLSVTVPHKERVLALCDYAGSAARRIGAANTLLRAGDGWRARNTDAGGFLSPLPGALGLNSAPDLKGMRALVIGAGGAARAAVHALDELGVRLVILNRSAGKAESLAAAVGADWGGLDESSAPLLRSGIDLAVQTGSAGMHPLEDINPLPWWDFTGCRLAYDMIYEPEETLFLQAARQAGVKTLNGSDMLVNQAKLQFELFTGVPVKDL